MKIILIYIDENEHEIEANKKLLNGVTAAILVFINNDISLL